MFSNVMHLNVLSPNQSEFQQLCYFGDVDYTESVDYLKTGPSDALIRERLVELATMIV
jgi:hypothetical protein